MFFWLPILGFFYENTLYHRKWQFLTYICITSQILYTHNSVPKSVQILYQMFSTGIFTFNFYVMNIYIML
jgi:hypothetical protein